MSSGTVRPFVDFTTATDSGENNAASVQPIADGEQVIAAVQNRPPENIRVRTEAIRTRQVDSLFLENADRVLVIAGPGKVTWPGSTTVAQTGIPVLTDTLWLLPMLTPGFAQTPPVPPVASAFGVIHLKRVTGSLDSIAVTSQRRSYAGGDQINITVTAGGAFSCVLDTEDTGALRRTIKIVATGATTLGATITALNGLTPPAPDNTQLVSAALENGALSGDLLLTAQARQFMLGNYDGEGHAITPANLASFFSSNPTQALAEGDTLCVSYDKLFDTASNGGRRQAIPENTNTAVAAGSFFNSRVHPENLYNALPVCKVINGRLVFGTGAEVPAGSVAFDFGVVTATMITYGGGGAWADGTTNPATTVENQFDKIIVDLAGAAGTGKIQGSAVGGDLASGTLAAQLVLLVNNWLKLSRANTVTGANLFSALQTLNGADDLTFALQTTTPPNTGTQRPKPIWELVVDTTAGIKARLYTLYEGGFMFTFNAAVSSMTGIIPNFTRDALTYTIGGGTARCFKVVFKSLIAVPNGNTDFSFHWYDPATGSPFSDTAWLSLMDLDSTRLRLGSGTSLSMALDLTDTIGKVKMLAVVRRAFLAPLANVASGTVSTSAGAPGADVAISTTAYFPLDVSQNVNSFLSLTLSQVAAGGSPTFSLVVGTASGTFGSVIGGPTSSSAANVILFGSYAFNAGESVWLKVVTNGSTTTKLTTGIIGGVIG